MGGVDSKHLFSYTWCHHLLLLPFYRGEWSRGCNTWLSHTLPSAKWCMPLNNYYDVLVGWQGHSQASHKHGQMSLIGSQPSCILSICVPSKWVHENMQFEESCSDKSTTFVVLFYVNSRMKNKVHAFSINSKVLCIKTWPQTNTKCVTLHNNINIIHLTKSKQKWRSSAHKNKLTVFLLGRRDILQQPLQIVILIVLSWT